MSSTEKGGYFAENRREKQVMWSNGIIIQANVHCFFAGEYLIFPEVQSRYFVWCRSGRGSIKINGTNFNLAAGNFIVAPWKHAIRYDANTDGPFVIGSIHIIPELAPGSPVVYKVRHEPPAEQNHFSLRHNRPWDGFETLRFGWSSLNSPLLAFAEFVVQAFGDHASEQELRDMVPVLRHEIEVACSHQESPPGKIPIGLQEMLSFIEHHLEQPISVEILAKWSGLSESSVFRLFRIHLGQTPGNYIYHHKMLHAARLLSSTNLSIGEIATRVAISDTNYFSRLFKRHLGMSAKSYRRTYSTDTMR